MLGYAALAILILSAAAYLFARRKAALLGANERLHSRPAYHGLLALMATLIPAILLIVAGDALYAGWMHARLEGLIAERAPTLPAIEVELVIRDAAAIAEGRLPSAAGALRDAVADAFARLDFWRQAVVGGLSLALAVGAAWSVTRRVDLDFRARNLAERGVTWLLLACAGVAVLTTLGILAALLGETLIFFNRIDWQVGAFLFGTTWSPLSGVFEGSLDADKVGALPLFAGTLMITVIALLVAIPIGLFSAIYLSEFAGPKTRATVKPLLEILAGIPTVVYGFFAAITVAPWLRDVGEAVGLEVSSQSALAAGAVMGIMIIPFISSLSDDVINAVPNSLREGSLGLGATQAETIRKVVLPAALPGIVSAGLLGFSRAVGETMIVVMAAGQAANLTANPLETVTTVTVQIVTLITGDTEADTAGPPAFALGFTLFFITLVLNMIALRIVNRYREAYE
jgi:phosphate transport system permease protein